LGENKPLPLIEAIIDKYILARIWKTADTLDWIDRQSVRSLIGEHIDATNLLVVARSKALGIPSEGVEQATVPVNYRLGDALSEAKNSGSATGALRAFMKTAYANPVGEFLDTHKEGNSLHQLDVLAPFSGFPFQAGLPVAFVYLIGYETSDLRGMISGKQDALSVERIQQLLIL
jgi:vacuolar-type H+-ATPase subunit C/Vma6